MRCSGRLTRALEPFLQSCQSIARVACEGSQGLGVTSGYTLVRCIGVAQLASEGRLLLSRAVRTDTPPKMQTNSDWK